MKYKVAFSVSVTAKTHEEAAKLALDLVRRNGALSVIVMENDGATGDAKVVEVGR